MTASEAVIDGDGTLVYGHSEALHQYGMQNGIPPIAAKLVLVDFDGTIVPWGPLMGDKEPIPGTVGAMRALRSAGFRIGIFTSRMSETWVRSVLEIPQGIPPIQSDKLHIFDFLARQRSYVADILNRHGIPFDFITAEKMPAEVYFDDKAVGVNETFTLAHAIAEFLGPEAE